MNGQESRRETTLSPGDTENAVTRKALKLRLPLALLGFVTFSIGAAVSFAWNEPPFDIVVLGSGCVLLAVVALIDILVVAFHLWRNKRRRLAG